MTPNPIITLTTDFGAEDPYVGVMKGVALGINPQAQLVDLTHSVRPQQVLQGSFLLSTVVRYFPPGTIHVAVVDPGVGTARRALAVQAGGYYFVGPDNGIFSHVLGELGVKVVGRRGAPAPVALKRGIRAVSLTVSRFWLHPVGSTFHGRDIFAPVAAHLSLGVPLEDFGDEVSSVLLYPLARTRRRRDGAVPGQVVHIDHFGNLITDVRGEDLPAGHVAVVVKGRTIHGISASYASGEEVEGPSLIALVGSSGYLEVSARNDSAAEVLGAGVGAPVQIRATK